MSLTVKHVRRLAVRQARVRISARHSMQRGPTERKPRRQQTRREVQSPCLMEINFLNLPDKSIHGWKHREGMYLIEYEAFLSLSDVAHDGVLCTYSIVSPRQGRSGPAARTVHHVEKHILLGHSPPASQACHSS